MSSNTPSLKQLLEQSERLATQTVDLPYVERNLESLEIQSRKLATKAAQSVGHKDSLTSLQQATPLAPEKTTKGYSVEIDQQTQSFHIDEFYQHDYERIIISTLEECRRETQRDFDEMIENGLQFEWEYTRKRLMKEIGQHQGCDESRISFGNRSLSALSNSMASIHL
ncbi:uncharacterized protein VTP21DRAFT_1645 [Calcarisporiella thermophila]|uniref:uncharacterized protein n=1 Tax=Calcarisporiella thermophila TaxID=911321 RepID=UPI003742E8CB